MIRWIILAGFIVLGDHAIDYWLDHQPVEQGYSAAQVKAVNDLVGRSLAKPLHHMSKAQQAEALAELWGNP